MIKFETINELTLKVTTTGNDVIFTKTDAFIAGDCSGNTNYRFEKVLLGPQKSLAQAALGSLMRRVTGENIPLTKVTMNGPSETYYAESAQHVLVYKLEPGETISVDPDAVICWMGNGACDPRITTDVNWKTFIGQASGESYSFEWHGGIPVTVIIQPSERSGGIRVAID